MAPTPTDPQLENHPVFRSAFDDRTQRTLLEDDSFAWRSVCSVLIAIVTLGLMIGLFAFAYSA